MLASASLFRCIIVAVVDRRDAADCSALMVQHRLDDMRGNTNSSHAAGGGSPEDREASRRRRRSP